MADLVGTSEFAIHRYESGWDRFEVRTLRRLAEALDAQLEIRLEPRVGVDDPRDVRDPVDRIAALFWDVELEQHHLLENPQWVLRRVLEFGDLEQNRWVRQHFGDEAIAVAARHRSMSLLPTEAWAVVRLLAGAGSLEDWILAGVTGAEMEYRVYMIYGLLQTVD